MKIAYSKYIAAFYAGIGAMLCITMLMFLNNHSNEPWLIASFGATMVILFSLPASPLARPKNIIIGHTLTTIVGLTVLTLIGTNEWSLGFAVGLSVLLMMLTNTTHPPAGANPLIVMLADKQWDFIFMPIISGTILIVSIGYLYHRFISKNPYPN